MNLGLGGRVAIVTGGSPGIGIATAERLACEGARVAITYCRHRDKAETLVKTLQAGGTDACAFFMDLAVPASIQATVDGTLARWRRIDVLVNNAAEWPRDPALGTVPFEDMPPTDWQCLLRTNLEGAYRAMQAVLPSMKERGWGRIVTVSSLWAEEGMPGFAWYAAAKAGLHGLNQSVAREAGPSGILANIVMPALTTTEDLPPAISASLPQRDPRSFSIHRPPRPDEVACVIAFLCSAENRVITGEIVRPTGGRQPS